MPRPHALTASRRIRNSRSPRPKKSGWKSTTKNILRPALMAADPPLVMTRFGRDWPGGIRRPRTRLRPDGPVHLYLDIESNPERRLAITFSARSSLPGCQAKPWPSGRDQMPENPAHQGVGIFLE